MYKYSLILICFFAASVLIFQTPKNVYAAHYLLGYDSVDGNEIRWTGSTQYSWEWDDAKITWNALDPIDILPDTWYTVADLTIGDVVDPGDSYYGRYYSGGTIAFNKYYMDQISYSRRRHVATHELGHALGLAHSISGNVMYDSAWQTSLGTQDIYDYDYLWN